MGTAFKHIFEAELNNGAFVNMHTESGTARGKQATKRLVIATDNESSGFRVSWIEVNDGGSVSTFSMSVSVQDLNDFIAKLEDAMELQENKKQP